MKEIIKAYKTIPWPKLEVPPMTRSNLLGLVLLTVGLIAVGWYIWFSGTIRVEYFAALGLVIPLAFFLKSRYIALIGLLCFQVVLAFIFIGNSDYAIIPIVVLIGAIIAFESPMAIYAVLIVAVWFDKSLFNLGSPLRVEGIVGAGLILSWIFKSLRRSHSSPFGYRFPDAGLALVLFAWILMGFALWCPQKYPAGWMQVKYIIVGVLFFLLTLLIVANEKHLNQNLHTWVWAGLIASIATAFAINKGYTGSPKQAAEGYLSLVALKNITATYIAYSFFLSLILYHWVRNRLLKIALRIVALIYLITIFKLEARATMIGLIIGFSVFIIASSYVQSRKTYLVKLFNRIVIILLISTLAVVTIFAFDLPSKLGLFGILFTDPISGSTMQYRFEAWSTARDILADKGHISRGLGVGAFYIFAPEYGFWMTDFTENVGLFHVHSVYLDILLHFGIIGLIIFIWMIIGNLVRLWHCFIMAKSLRYQYLALGIFCGLVSFYLHIIIDGAFFSLIDWWLYFGFSVAVINIISHQLDKNGN